MRWRGIKVYELAGAITKRLRKEAGMLTISEAYEAARGKCCNWLDENLETTMTLARGIVVVQKVKLADGTIADRYYKKEPLFVALVYLIDRAMGKVGTERNPTDDALTKARTDFINTQLSVQFLEAQVKDMTARADRALVETSKWEQQFVTEDEQREQLRELARAANRALMELTPLKLQELLPGLPEPEEALSRLRGYLGREQAAILEDVLSGGKAVADEEEE